MRYYEYFTCGGDEIMANAKFFNLITLDKVNEAFKKCNYSFFENGDYN